MEKISTIGLDIAKNVFQVHGIDEDGTVVVRRQVKRKQLVAFFSDLQPCLVGMEACATAHHWTRELVKLGGTPVWRENFVTDNGNDILDVGGLDVVDAAALESRINDIAGVVTVGIFARRPADVLLIADDKGVEQLTA